MIQEARIYRAFFCDVDLLNKLSMLTNSPVDLVV